MKIKNVREITNPSLNLLHVEENANTAGFSQSFDRQFQSKGREKYDEYVKELANKINEQGNLLTKRVDIAELQRYRELISELISSVVSNAYRFSKDNVFDMRGRRRVFSTIDRINEKLEELATEILSEQKDNISILNKVDDIRGLVLDMML